MSKHDIKRDLTDGFKGPTSVFVGERAETLRGNLFAGDLIPDPGSKLARMCPDSYVPVVEFDPEKHTDPDHQTAPKDVREHEAKLKAEADAKAKAETDAKVAEDAATSERIKAEAVAAEASRPRKPERK